MSQRNRPTHSHSRIGRPERQLSSIRHKDGQQADVEDLTNKADNTTDVLDRTVPGRFPSRGMHAGTRRKPKDVGPTRPGAYPSAIFDPNYMPQVGSSGHQHSESKHRVRQQRDSLPRQHLWRSQGGWSLPQEGTKNSFRNGTSSDSDEIKRLGSSQGMETETRLDSDAIVSAGLLPERCPSRYKAPVSNNKNVKSASSKPIKGQFSIEHKDIDRSRNGAFTRLDKQRRVNPVGEAGRAEKDTREAKRIRDAMAVTRILDISCAKDAVITNNATTCHGIGDRSFASSSMYQRCRPEACASSPTSSSSLDGDSEYGTALESQSGLSQSTSRDSSADTPYNYGNSTSKKAEMSFTVAEQRSYGPPRSSRVKRTHRQHAARFQPVYQQHSEQSEISKDMHGDPKDHEARAKPHRAYQHGSTRRQKQRHHVEQRATPDYCCTML